MSKEKKKKEKILGDVRSTSKWNRLHSIVPLIRTSKKEALEFISYHSYIGV